VHSEAVGGALGAVAVGVVFVAAGLALGLDYRGFTAWHVRTSIRFSHPLTAIPPWRWLPERLKGPDAYFQRFYQLERVMGWLFAVAGGVALVTGCVALVMAAV